MLKETLEILAKMDKVGDPNFKVIDIHHKKPSSGGYVLTWTLENGCQYNIFLTKKVPIIDVMVELHDFLFEETI